MTHHIQEIKSSIDGGRLTAYSFLFRAERNALIDSGGNTTPVQDIMPALKEAGVSPLSIHYILNTHGHYDHTGGNAEIKEATGARIGIHEEEEILMADQSRYFRQWFSPVVTAIGGPELVEPEWKMFAMLAGPEIKADFYVKENDIIDLGKGIDLIVIELPGHTSGSVGYYWDKEGVLFSGDALPGLFIPGGLLPVILDLDQYIASIKKLQGLNIRTIYNSHDHRGINTPPHHVQNGIAVKEYLSDCLESALYIQEAILETVPHSEGKTMLEIYNEVVKKIPARMAFKPILQGPIFAFSAFVIYFTMKKLNVI